MEADTFTLTVQEALEQWGHYYNHMRPHSALQCLCSADYYRGDPIARLAERKEKLAWAVEARKAYWQEHAMVKEPVSLA